MTEEKADKLLEELEGAASEMVESPRKSANISTSDRNLSLILDIPLKVSVELGRTKMPVSDLLNLTQGSVIELNKLAGEPMEVYVNDKLIARGEAVVVNEKFGVRLTDIISPAERVEQLR
jgi:flagellar motor switch protein FliN/FliY